MTEQKEPIIRRIGKRLFQIGLVLSFLTGFNIFATPPAPGIDTQWIGIGVIVVGCVLPFIGSKLASVE